jgi:repressor LexA
MSMEPAGGKYRARVASFYKKHRRMPNITELMALFRLRSRASAFYVSERLIESGMAAKDKTGKLVPTDDFFSLPKVGRIRAGFAAPAEEEIADTVAIGDYLIRDPNASYLLQVEGDSMEGAGILHGDLVVFERTQDYKPGDIVVALTEDGYTLKYLRKRGARFHLEAANEDYPDIHPREGQIIGKAVSSFRKYA